MTAIQQTATLLVRSGSVLDDYGQKTTVVTRQPVRVSMGKRTSSQENREGVGVTYSFFMFSPVQSCSIGDALEVNNRVYEIIELPFKGSHPFNPILRNITKLVVKERVTT